MSLITPSLQRLPSWLPTAAVSAPVQPTVLPLAPALRPANHVHSRVRRLDKSEAGLAATPSPALFSDVDLESEAYERVFVNSLYGPYMTGVLLQFEGRISMFELEQTLLKPLLEAGFFDLRIEDGFIAVQGNVSEQLQGSVLEQRSMGDICAKVLLRGQGLGEARYSSAAVSAMIRLVRHLQAHAFVPSRTSGGVNRLRDSTLVQGVRIAQFISNLSMSTDQLIRFAEHIGRIDSRQLVLNQGVLRLFEQHSEHLDAISRLLDALRRSSEAPVTLSLEESELFSIRLAGDPDLTESGAAELKNWVDDPDGSRKIVRYLAAMAPAAAGAAARPFSAQRAADAPRAYQKIWQFLEMMKADPQQMTANRWDELLTELARLAPLEHQAEVKAAYAKMKDLGLLQKGYYWVLPLLRPEMAAELRQSDLLRTLTKSDSERAVLAFIDYLKAARSPGWVLELYSRLGPSKVDFSAAFRRVRLRQLYGLSEPEGVERLYALYQQTGAAALTTVEEKRDFLAVEIIKSELAKARKAFLTPEKTMRMVERPAIGEDIRAVNAVRSLINMIAWYPLAGDNAKVSLQMLESTIQRTTAAERAASLESIEHLAEACRCLARDPESRLDAETLDAFRLAGVHAPALAAVLATLPQKSYRVLVRPEAVRWFISLNPPRQMASTLVSFEQFCRQFSRVWARRPILSSARNEAIRNYLAEPDKVKKTLLYISLMVAPEDAASIKVPISTTSSPEPSLPYRRISAPPSGDGSLQGRLLQAPEIRDDYLSRLALFVPVQYQPSVRAVYEKMRTLGILDLNSIDYLALPLVRPELAEELRRSVLLEEIGRVEDKKREWILNVAIEENALWRLILHYIEMAASPDWRLQLPPMLDPNITLRRLYQLYKTGPAESGKPHSVSEEDFVAAKTLRFSVAAAQQQLRTPGQPGALGARGPYPLLSAHELPALANLPAVKAFRDLQYALKQRLLPVGETEALLSALQQTLDDPHSQQDQRAQLLLFERRCLAFHMQLSVLPVRLSLPAIQAILNAGLHAPALARFMSALNDPTYETLVRQQSLGLLWIAFRRRLFALPPATQEALLSSAGYTRSQQARQQLEPALERFAQTIEQLAENSDPKEQKKAWLKQMVWEPAQPQQSVQRVWEFWFRTSVDPSRWWSTRMIRKQLNTLALPAETRNRLLLLWLSVPELSQDLSRVLLQSPTVHQLAATVSKLEAAIPGIRDHAASRRILSEQLGLSLSTLENRLSPAVLRRPGDAMAVPLRSASASFLPSIGTEPLVGRRTSRPGTQTERPLRPLSLPLPTPLSDSSVGARLRQSQDAPVLPSRVPSASSRAIPTRPR